MKNIDKGLTVPKWVLIVWPKIPQMLQNLSARFVCPSPKVWDINEKRLHLASVVRALWHSSRAATIVQNYFIYPYIAIGLYSTIVHQNF